MANSPAPVANPQPMPIAPAATPPATAAPSALAPAAEKYDLKEGAAPYHAADGDDDSPSSPASDEGDIY